MSAEELAAYATVAAVIVALGIPLAQAWWRWMARPVIQLDFENRPRWRVRSQLVTEGQQATTGVVGLFFRLRVTNVGWSPAIGVTGRLSALLDQGLQPVDNFDPVSLHWAGTSFRDPTSSIQLLPGQSEYLDVVRVDADTRRPIDNSEEFQVVVHDSTHRGIELKRHIAGQTLRVIVAASNCTGNGYELQMPKSAMFANRFLSLKHRPVDRFGAGLYPWDEQPPPRLIGGLMRAGIDAGPATTRTAQ